MTAQELLASIGLLVCLVMLLRMGIGERRRAGIDSRLQVTWRNLRAKGRLAWTERRNRKASGEAAREAEELIQRARQGKPAVPREGNVYRPRQFGSAGRGEEGDGNDRPDGRHRRDH
jgi:hypothetical protein